MKTKNKTRIIATALALFSLAYAGNSQSLKWDKIVNGSQNSTDKGYAVAVDDSANVYMTGYEQNSSTGFDIVVVKYNSSGTQKWLRTYSGSLSSTVVERGNCIALDANHNVFVAGTAYNGANNNDFCLLKWSSGGVFDNTHYPKFYADASGTEVPEAKSVVVVSTTAVYVSGSTYDVTNGWKLLVEKDNVGGNGWDATFTAYTYQGSLITTRHEANDLRADANYVYVTGVYANNTEGTNCVTAKINASSGSQSWAATYNTSTYDNCSNALSVDGNNNVWIAGYSNTASTGKDALIIEYNSGGTQQWATTYNGANNLDDVWNDIALFPGGGSTIAGVTGFKTINATAGSYDKDYITATYNSSGNLWASWSTNPKTYNGSKAAPESAITDEAWAIEYSNNRLYVSGRSFETPTEMDITTIGYTPSNGTQAWINSYTYNSSNGQDEMFNKYGLYALYNGTYCVDEIYVVGDAQTSNAEDCVTLKYSCISCNPCRLANPNQLEAGFFPNPFSSSATLRINQETIVNNATLKIYDLSGKVVLVNTEINNNEITIERSSMATGIYFYELTDESRIIASGKFAIE